MRVPRARIGLICLAAGVSLGSILPACDTGKIIGDTELDAGTGGSSGPGGPGLDASAGAGGSPGGGATGPDGGTADGGARDGTLPDTGGAAAGGSGPGTGGRATGGASGGTGGATGTGGGSGGAGALPPVTIWIAGDSTVANGTAPCPIGWGGQFKALFNPQVTVTNSAIAGRSVRTWLYFPTLTMDATGECILPLDAAGNPTIQPRWQAMLTGMKAGDYLFIQFGINDSDGTCDRHVGIDAFKASYGVMAQAAKDRGAHPIFVTPPNAIQCSSAAVPVATTRGGFVAATQQAGVQYGAPVIDLNALSVARYTALHFCPIPGGGDVSATTSGAVGDYFCDDHTHFSPSGAVDIAALIAGAVRAQIPGLASYLK